MTESAGIRRRLIEVIRRGLHSIGVDIHRVRPQPLPISDRKGIFNAVIALRHEVYNSSAADEVARFFEFSSNHLLRSHAQLLQDLFVLFELGDKRGGFYVEFGATDGVSINNTFMLERDFGWKGILAEPGKSWHERLRKNRNSQISTDCVWRQTGEILTFNDAEDGELSGIEEQLALDGHEDKRKNGHRYPVRTISLTDLLNRFDAPRVVDYMSVDTEGSEYEILSAFDFNRYDVRIITVEHNYTPNRAKIHDLLVGFGYQRKFQELSQWDDWYVRRQ